MTWLSTLGNKTGCSGLARGQLEQFYTWTQWVLDSSGPSHFDTLWQSQRGPLVPLGRLLLWHLKHCMNLLAALRSHIKQSTDLSPSPCIQSHQPCTNHTGCFSLLSYHSGRKKAPSDPPGPSLSRTPVCCCVSLCSTALQSARCLITQNTECMRVSYSRTPEASTVMLCSAYPAPSPSCPRLNSTSWLLICLHLHKELGCFSRGRLCVLASSLPANSTWSADVCASVSLSDKEVGSN